MSLLNLRKLYLLLILSFICELCKSQSSVQDYYELSEKQHKEGNYAGELNSNIGALKLTEQNNDANALAFGNIQVGRSYYFLQNRRLALMYFFKSRQLINDHAIDSLKFIVNYNIGVMYTELESADSALYFYNEARLALLSKPNYRDMAKLNGVIADLHLNLTHNLELAKYYIMEAEKNAVMSNDLNWKAFVNIKYFIYYKFKKDYAMSLKYARLANSMYEANGDLDGRMYGLNALAGALALTNNPEAKNVYEKLISLRDSVFGAETANKIAHYKTLYETEKKEDENKLLFQKNQLNKSEIDAKNKTIIGLLIGVLLIIISAFWRISIINLRKKNKELEATRAMQKEKERISRDLHDNVGGQLSYVLYSMEGMNDSNVEKRMELTTNINESIRNVIGNLRETIWAMNDELITVTDLSDKLKLYTRKMFRNTPTKISIKENILHNVALNAVAGLNLYRICQEIINNVFKHAGAEELNIEINADVKTTIIIGDNGVGFDRGKTGNDSFGLSNIKSRAEEAGITISLQSETNKGTTYTLIV